MAEKTLSEKMQYIRGLCDGLEIDASKPENKVLMAIIDFLDDAAFEIEETADAVFDIEDEFDEINEIVNMLADDFYDEGDHECDCCCDDDEEDYDFDSDEEFYEVTCGKCGESICFSDDVLFEGETDCPNCGELLEFDFSEMDEETESEA